MLDVRTLVKMIASTLAANDELRGVSVHGELSNYTQQKSGHLYFTIKDIDARLSCVMFKSNASRLKFVPSDGMQVILRGDITVFEAGGQVQLNVTMMEPDGVGQLYLQYEATKLKLQQEGLFDPRYKKNLPQYPLRIGVIVGKDSAAQADIKINLAKRWPVADVDYYEANVQGIKAVNELIEQLLIADQNAYDLIILARGGGSFEDLNAFNSEALCRCVYAMHTPVITGIGHESDTTLVDYVADMRAPTPTAAVVLSCPDYHNVQLIFKQYRQRIAQSIVNLQTQQSLKLNYYQNSLSGFLVQFSTKATQFTTLKEKLTGYATNYKNNQTSIMQTFNHRLLKAISASLNDKKQQQAKLCALMDAYSPLKILSRGYAIVSDQQSIITSVDQVVDEQLLQIRLSNGLLTTQVKHKEKKT